MKDKKSVVIAVIVVVMVAGLFLMMKAGKDEGWQGGESEVKVEEKTEGKEEREVSVFESIKEAMARSLSLKCEYDSGNGKVTVYIKGNNLAIDGYGQENSRYQAIIKGDKMWVWNKDKKEGFIFTTEAKEGEQSGFSSEEIIADVEKEKQFCKTAVVSDSAFDLPANVKFQDVSSMMGSF